MRRTGRSGSIGRALFRIAEDDANAENLVVPIIDHEVPYKMNVFDDVRVVWASFDDIGNVVELPQPEPE